MKFLCAVLCVIACLINCAQAQSESNLPLPRTSAGIVRINLNQVSIDAVAKFGARIVIASGRSAEQKEDLQAALDETLGFMRAQFLSLTRAGIDRIYVVILQDPAQGSRLSYLVIEGDGAFDLERAQRVLKESKLVVPMLAMLPGNGAANVQMSVVHGEIVLGTRDALAQVTAIPKPSASSLGDAVAREATPPIAGAIMVDPDPRRSLLRGLPGLANDDADVYGKYASMLLFRAGDSQEQCFVQRAACRNAADAAALESYLRSEFHRREPMLRQLLGRRADVVLSGIAYHVEGAAMISSVSSRAFETVMAPLMLTSLDRVDQSRRGIESARHMSQLLVALWNYSAAHHYQFPDDLQSLADTVGGREKLAALLLNPRLRSETVGYIYVKPPRPMRPPGSTVVLYERPGRTVTQVHVGFLDAHIEPNVPVARLSALLAGSNATTQPSVGSSSDRSRVGTSPK